MLENSFDDGKCVVTTIYDTFPVDTASVTSKPFTLINCQTGSIPPTLSSGRIETRIGKMRMKRRLSRRRICGGRDLVGVSKIDGERK